jgi:hypothetical protein
MSLLHKYEDGYNRVGLRAEAGSVRDFIHLFYNSRVPVVNDTGENPNPGTVSAEEFVTNLSGLYPEGIRLTFDRKRMWIRDPRYDRNYRYVIDVRVWRTLSGSYRNTSIESMRKLDIQVTFSLKDNQPEGFAIYGADMLYQGAHLLDIGISPTLSGLVNGTIRDDARLQLTNGMGFSGGVDYLYDFSEHLGLGAGLHISRYEGAVKLDRFDALGNFDPGMKEVTIDNLLLYAELPVFLTSRQRISERLEVRLNAGCTAGYRLFEEMSSSAVNTGNGVTMVNVISDPGWIGNLNRMNLSLLARLSINLHLSTHFDVYLGADWVRGLTNLDNNTRTDFVSTKYQGQYNPLWGAPGRSVTQSYGIQAGVVLRMDKKGGK